ncbi:MAG: SIMPL domain-containing protein [Chloroflexota bacterium]
MPPRTITVSGVGRVGVEPDLADLRLGVTFTSLTVRQARAANATAMGRVIDALKGLGIESRDIQTTNLSLNAVYDYSSNTDAPRLTGYTLSNTVAVTIRDIGNVGEAIDGALEAGATSLESIAFRVEDSSAAEKLAREAAVADAQARAAVLAAAAGVSITGVAAITESGQPIPVPLFHKEMAMMAARDAATPVETGTNEVAVSVVVTYLIG